VKNASQELTVFLSGALYSSDVPYVNKIVSGQHFGGIELVSH